MRLHSASRVATTADRLFGCATNLRSNHLEARRGSQKMEMASKSQRRRPQMNQSHQTNKTTKRTSEMAAKMAPAAIPTTTTTNWAPSSQLSYLLLMLIIALMAPSSISAQKSTTQSQQAGSGAANDIGVTQSYSEAIKWSFGGWAPLSHQQRAQLNASSLAGPLPRRNNHPVAPPPMHMQQQQQQQQVPIGLNGTRPSAAGRGPASEIELAHKLHRQAGPESLSESASSAQDNVHFVGLQGPPPNARAHHEPNQHQARPALQNGPAYAMQTNKEAHPQQQQFSVPAPAPIVREQLLPSANHQRALQQHPQQQRMRPHFRSQAHMHMQPPIGHQHRQPHPPHHHHHHQAPYQRPAPNELGHPRRPHHAPGNRHEQHLREMDRRHKQHMMQHHHRHQMMMQQQQQHQQHLMQQAMQQQQSMHHAPAVPYQPRQPKEMHVIHPVAQAAAHPNVGTFKVIEGEQPVVFSAPAQLAEEAPGQAPFKPNATTGNRAHQMAPYSQSAMAAIEKDNLNYNQAMRQVSNSLIEEQQKTTPSNNIQEVKQRQINDQHQQQQQHQTSSSKSPYLTIPVAVETEGDKVLTPDDINEIEKHVINVLPNLKTADKLVKIADTQLDLAHIKSTVEQARKLEQQHEQQQKHHQQQQHSQQQQQPQQVAPNVGPAEMHQMNYDEHRSTMRQLEGLGRPTTASLGDYRASTSGATTSGGPSPASATTAARHHHRQQHQSQAASAPGAHHQAMSEHEPSYQLEPNENEADVEHQYYTAAGPAQEVEQVDPDQMVDYNLIKNDLLQNIHYEPTRAQPGSQSQSQAPQTASTPPMPYTTTSHHQQNQQQQQEQQQQHNQAGGHSTSAGTTSRVPSVTRYFHQGRQAATGASGGPHQAHNRPDRNQLFGRLRPHQGHNHDQQQQVTSTTRTIMGGRKVSEVMRPLVHTTPVPLTSPMHVPSVEPEKVDAIQFIAGNAASDKQPVVVEAHQLVSHTPDGGIDYSSGGMQQQQQQQQQQPQQTMPNANQTYQLAENQQQQQPQQQQQFYPQANPNEESQGAIIEYVSISDQALNNALAQQQQHPTTNGQQQQQQAYEIASTPEVQPVYMNEQQQQPQEQDQRNSPQPPLLYAYSTQQQQQQDQPGQPGSTASYQGSTESPQTMMVVQQEQHQPESPSLAWSPSIANEHQQQQQQLELSGQVGPMQQLEFPATAGYNLFGQQQQSQQQQEQQTSVGPNGAYEQQEQQEPEQDHHSRWRTKAGGRQPNPDAQYDGQIAKDAQGGDDEDQHQQQQQVLGANDQQEKKGEHHQQNHEQQQQQQMMVIDDGQQQQQQQYATTGYANQQRPTLELTRLAQAAGNQDEQQPAGNGAEQQQHERANYDQQQQQQAGVADSYQQQGSTMDNESRDGFGSTSAYVGGAQVNHQTPSGGMRYTRPPQSYGQSTSASSEQSTGAYGYAKLDRDQQQQHLEQQRAQHQAQLAELMSQQQQQQQQQQYQTTTPLSLTTASDQQQQQQEVVNQQRTEQEVRQEQEQPLGQQLDSNTALLIHPDAPIQMQPILDQQSLIHDQDQTGHEALTSSSDDGPNAAGKHLQGHHHNQQQQQPAAVYQVYQAYYAPKDHKPLPGYIRLSLDEFNELFKDAEIQVVDKNLNGLTANLMSSTRQQQQQQPNQQQQGQQTATSNAGNEQQADGYDLRSQQSYQDHMRASGSELQSIVVDGRSIADRRSSNATGHSPMEANKLLSAASDKKLRQLGQAAVKKIISIRNSRQAAKQATLADAGTDQKIGGSSKLVMKRFKSALVATSGHLPTTKQQAPVATTTTTNSTTASGSKTSSSLPTILATTTTATTAATSTPRSTTSNATVELPAKKSAVISAAKISQTMPKKKIPLQSKTSPKVVAIDQQQDNSGNNNNKTAGTTRPKLDDHNKKQSTATVKV